MADPRTEPLLPLADHYLAEYLDKIDRSTAPLPPAAIWRRADERSNSIGNLLLHLRGNLTQVVTRDNVGAAAAWVGVDRLLV